MTAKRAARAALAATLLAAALVVTSVATEWMLSPAHAYGLAGVIILTSGTLAHIATLLGDD